jgi:hypothetical protein
MMHKIDFRSIICVRFVSAGHLLGPLLRFPGPRDRPLPRVERSVVRRPAVLFS